MSKEVKVKFRKSLLDCYSVDSQSSSRKEDDLFKMEDYKKLFNELRDKIQSTSSESEKKRILTLVPDSWTIDQTVQYFGASYVSAWIVREAKTIKSGKGLLSDPNVKKGHPIFEDVKQIVTEYYLRESN